MPSSKLTADVAGATCQLSGWLWSNRLAPSVPLKRWRRPTIVRQMENARDECICAAGGETGVAQLDARALSTSSDMTRTSVSVSNST